MWNGQLVISRQNFSQNTKSFLLWPGPICNTWLYYPSWPPSLLTGGWSDFQRGTRWDGENDAKVDGEDDTKVDGEDDAKVTKVGKYMLLCAESIKPWNLKSSEIVKVKPGRIKARGAGAPVDIRLVHIFLFSMIIMLRSMQRKTKASWFWKILKSFQWTLRIFRVLH